MINVLTHKLRVEVPVSYEQREEPMTSRIVFADIARIWCGLHRGGKTGVDVKTLESFVIEADNYL